MQILTNITATEPDVRDEIDQYVGGIFIQMTYNDTSKTMGYVYHKAVDCQKHYPEYDPANQAIYDGFLCPDAPHFTLQGNMGERESDPGSEYYFVVNSCQSMNDIYHTEFNEAWSECKPYEEV